MRAIHLAALLLPALMASAQPRPTGPELLTNGGFEQPGEEGQPAGWRGFFTLDWGDCSGSARLSDDRPHSGEYCYEVFGVRERFAAAPHERVEIDPEQAYVLSGWVRTQLARGQSAYLVASWFSDDGWLSLTRSVAVYGRQPWTRLELVIRPSQIPARAVDVMISFRVSGTSARGRAWIDDMSLRECEVEPTADSLHLQRSRLIDMARELLIERARWEARLETLTARREDLQELLGAGEDFDALVRRWGDAAAAGDFLTRPEPDRADLEAAGPEDPGQVREQVELLRELPRLRRECYAELDRLARLKRRLEGARRRFYLWAQLAALRPEPLDGEEPVRAQFTPEFAPALTEPPAQPAGELLNVDVRAEPVRGGRAGTVTVSGELLGDDAASVQAGLLSPSGEPAGFAAVEPDDGRVELRLRTSEPLLWFPDCRHTYLLRVAVFRDGRAVDWLQQRVAFRTVEMVETDVSATMRHAWGLAPTDYALCVNGQPYFARGTRCGQVSEFPDEAAALFDELWLDYQRTYGDFLGRLSAADADALDERGLTHIGALAPDYNGIRSYVSSRAGLEQFRATTRHLRWLASHPLLLGIEIGNEEELAVWGADLPSAYGEDLWHAFNEVNRVVEEELAPTVPVGYVRATRFHNVRPVPRNDYSGVNQYTGRYFGRRCTIASDLAELAFSATCDDTPIAITEWNGPKYSWATRGVSGVDEEGAAAYIFDYFRQMRRTPTTVMSTEFVLNWIPTPVEDLTTMPLEEGLRRRDQWRWSLQKGVPWYPAIWPDLLSDTACRRTMRGFQSPLLDLCETPGEIVVAAVDARGDDARRLAGALQDLGRTARAAPMPTPGQMRSLDANLLLIGGTGGDQPDAIQALARMRVIGRTTDGSPPDERFFIQRRVNPHHPDRFLVTVTAADDAGMNAALRKLVASVQGLREAYGRAADRRRMLALVDDSEGVARVFARYVAELPTRSVIVSRDDARTRLDPHELLDGDGRPTGCWRELAAVVVATGRALEPEEVRALRALREAEVRIVWSAAALVATDAAPEVALGAEHSLTERLPVQQWAQKPLVVPDAGDVAAERVRQFAGIEPGSDRWTRGMTIRELVPPEGWRVATATEAGAPVVACSPAGDQWAFGCDLAGVATALWSTTQQGKLHAIYDRDTACGLERVFRLLTNAAAGGIEDRPASTPRLHAQIATDRIVYEPDATVRVTVRVRDADGAAADADVRVTLAKGDRLLGLPGEGLAWARAERVAAGTYAVRVPLAEAARRATVDVQEVDHRGQSIVTIFAEATQPGRVGDWTCTVARIGLTSEEDARMRRLAELVREGRVELPFSVHDDEQWVEVEALASVPAEIEMGEPARFDIDVTRVEDERGNDLMEDVELVLRAADGREVRLPLAPGRILTGANSPMVAERPEEYLPVSADRPARLSAEWAEPGPGRWTLLLRYVYTDQYRIEDTDHVPREDAFAAGTFTVGEP